MNGVQRHFFEFGAFRIDVGERRLLHNGGAVTLASRAFDLLLALVQNAGHAVDKDDLMRNVWTDTFVEEGNLNHHVSMLRKVLGDDLKEQRFIKTLPKRGYQFTADVHEIVESNEEIAVETVSRGRLVIKEETTESHWTLTRVAVACGLAAVVLIGAWAFSFAGKSAGHASWTSNKDAADAYARGRELWQNRSAADLYKATQLLEKAVQTDPDFALAHSALADAYAFDYYNWPRAVGEARKAIEIDAGLGEPHASIGFVLMFWERDLNAAKAEFSEAVKLSPDYATGRQWYALNLASLMMRDASVVEVERARSLEPDSVAIKTDACQVLYYAERYDAAMAQCLGVIEKHPENIAARQWLYETYMAEGDHDKAVEAFAAVLSASTSDRIRNEAVRLKQAYRAGGIERFRQAQIEFYTNIDHRYYQLARVLSEAGRTDEAVAALIEAYDEKDIEFVFCLADPAISAVRWPPTDIELTSRLLKPIGVSSN